MIIEVANILANISFLFIAFLNGTPGNVLVRTAMEDEEQLEARPLNGLGTV